MLERSRQPYKRCYRTKRRNQEVERLSTDELSVYSLSTLVPIHCSAGSWRTSILVAASSKLHLLELLNQPSTNSLNHPRILVQAQRSNIILWGSATI